MSDTDPSRLADQLEREAKELERRSGELRDQVKGVGDDWERKRADQSVPGAPAPETSDDEPPSDTGDNPPSDTGDDG